MGEGGEKAKAKEHEKLRPWTLTGARTRNLINTQLHLGKPPPKPSMAWRSGEGDAVGHQDAMVHLLRTLPVCEQCRELLDRKPQY